MVECAMKVRDPSLNQLNSNPKSNTLHLIHSNTLIIEIKFTHSFLEKKQLPLSICQMEAVGTPTSSLTQVGFMLRQFMDRRTISSTL